VAPHGKPSLQAIIRYKILDQQALSSASNYVSDTGVLDVLLLDDIWNDIRKN